MHRGKISLSVSASHPILLLCFAAAAVSGCDAGSGRNSQTGANSGLTQLAVVDLADNRTRQLIEFRGKVVVLDFWSRTCPPCQIAMDKMQTYRDRHPEWGDRVVLMSVNVDPSREGAASHIRAKGWNRTYNTWGGIRQEAARALEVRTIPHAVVFDAAGQIVTAGNPLALDIPALVVGLLRKSERP